MTPGTITFKDFAIFLGIRNHMASQTLFDILGFLTAKHGVMVTESWREQRHKNDLHGTRPLRAVDIRSWHYEDPEAVVAAVNDRWQYDPGRPQMRCALLHDSGQGPHIHIQVHPRTEEKDGWQ